MIIETFSDIFIQEHFQVHLQNSNFSTIQGAELAPQRQEFWMASLPFPLFLEYPNSKMFKVDIKKDIFSS